MAPSSSARSPTSPESLSPLSAGNGGVYHHGFMWKRGGYHSQAQAFKNRGASDIICFSLMNACAGVRALD